MVAQNLNMLLFEKTINEYNRLLDEFSTNRNNQLIKGFILKAEEECSFNDFYSNGNDDILKYAGVINGLSKSKFNFFEQTSSDLMQKIEFINRIAKELLLSKDEYNNYYHIFFKNAELALYSFSEENTKFSSINHIAEIKKELLKANEIAISKKNVFSANLELQQSLTKIEKRMKEVELVNQLLKSSKFIKRNAFYSVKKMDWIIEKNNVKNSENMDLKKIFGNQLQLERLAQDEIVSVNLFELNNILVNKKQINL